MVYINRYKNLPYAIKRLHRLGRAHGAGENREVYYARKKGELPEVEMYSIEDACKRAGI